MELPGTIGLCVVRSLACGEARRDALCNVVARHDGQFRRPKLCAASTLLSPEALATVAAVGFGDEPQMLDFQTLILFSLACLALAATPGPDMLLIASRSIAQGRSAGFATLAGIQAGTYCHALAAAFGLSKLFLLVPVAYDVVRYLGAAYLLFLAWQAFTSSSLLAPASCESQQRTKLVVFRQG